MSRTNCPWLPKLILRKIGETDDEYLNRLYPIFENDFKKCQPLFKGWRVGCRKLPIINGKEEGFFHLTSFDYLRTGFENRVVDDDRCMRIRWIRSIIENYQCEKDCCRRLLIWNEKKRWRILFPDERYIVVLDQRNGYFVVVTAYYIDKLHEHELQRYIRQHS